MAVKYLELASGTGGFLAIKNQMVMQLDSISLSQSLKTDTVSTFDQNFVETSLPTWQSYSFDASGIVDSTTTGYQAYTGGTAANTLTGSTNGELLFEAMKARQMVTLVLKHDSNAVERGNCIITSCDLKFSAGKNQTFSIKGVICGALTKSTT